MCSNGYQVPWFGQSLEFVGLGEIEETYTIEERYAALIHLPSLPVCATKSVIGLNNNNNWIKDFLLFVNTNPFFMVCLICYLFSKMGKQDKIHEPNAPKFLFFHFLLN